MTGRDLAPGDYAFDDVMPGDRWRTAEREVTGDLIDRFAALTGDRFEIHMDDGAARAMGFPSRVAHGLLVLGLVDGLKNAAPVRLRAVASLGWDWSFRAPVLVGHRLHARIRVAEKRPVSRPGRGILKLDFEVRERAGDILQRGANLLMVVRNAS